MDLENKKDNIEIRSEEVQEIMSHIPHWILRIGIGIILGMLILSLILAYLIKYPDILIANITITSTTPPTNVIAKSTGKMDSIFVINKQQVLQNEVLAVIYNTASYNDIIKTKVYLEEISETISGIDTLGYIQIERNNYTLGEIQDSYMKFTKSVNDFNNFIIIDFHNKKINKLETQISKNIDFSIIEKNQYKLSQRELGLSKKQFNRESVLFVQQLISESQYDLCLNKYIEKINSLENSKKSLINSELRINQLEQQILDLTLEYKSKIELLKTEIHYSSKNLKNAINKWEFNYVLKSPINGKVVFTRMWSVNQNISAGNAVFAVIPETQNNLIGKLILPVSGAGKVVLNQTVNIKLHNYPYKEFGMLTGKVVNISDIPVDSVYFVDISLPNGLLTNYNKQLHFSQGMTGQAEIITENINLLARLIQPIRAIISNNIKD